MNAKREGGHTAGPWHWVNSVTDEPFDFDADWDGDGLPSLRTVEEYAGTIYSLPKWILDTDEPMQNGNDAANARLIAAAPDLLEALKSLLLTAYSGGLLVGEAHRMAEAAIAQATGAGHE